MSSTSLPAGVPPTAARSLTRRRCRTAFTLVEVAVAAAILFASLAILSQLAYIGRKHLDKAEQIATASRLAENELARLVARIEPIETTDSSPLAEDPGWECRIELAPTEFFDLWELRVAVRKLRDDPNLQAEPDLRPWFQLTEWIGSDLLPAELRRDATPTPGSRPGLGRRPSTRRSIAGRSSVGRTAP